ncbi:MAG: head-tail adaptor protein [Rhodobacteraceae bacterium]|nr:head-tail adaptor protein [Paracoccaceae bacterium]
MGPLYSEKAVAEGVDHHKADLIFAAVPYRITVRAAPTGAVSRPKAGQRFREGTRLFPILAVTEADPYGRFLTCFAREEVAT